MPCVAVVMVVVVVLQACDPVVHDCIVDPTQQSGPPDVDQSMKELLKQPGVEGYMVFNDTGEYTSLRPPVVQRCL